MAFEIPPRNALSLWHDVALDLVHEGEFDFSLRQLAILFTIYLEEPPHTVRGLASKLKVTKPVITRALDTMGQRDLVKRRRDDDDRRARHQSGDLGLEARADDPDAGRGHDPAGDRGAFDRAVIVSGYLL